MIRLLHGDCRVVLPTLPSASVQCCVTSPPYYGLRDYGVAGQIGLEQSPDAYMAELVAVFREVRRVLRDDGVLFLNLGDSYAGGNQAAWRAGNPAKNGGNSNRDGLGYVPGLKPKDLIGIPWMVAFALRADGWWLRSDIIWAKPNPMPESVTDRPTRSHEYVFLLTKSARYHYDAIAIAEPLTRPEEANRATPARFGGADKFAEAFKQSRLHSGNEYRGTPTGTRNARSVWTIASAPFAEAHFATFPPELAERCIKAGSRPGDTILDPFSGAGTTSLVADRLGRDAIGIDLNEDYVAMARRRVVDDCPLFAEVAE